ncbi:MAG: aldo/keto reductase [Gammaproteobacteria bacterium]|nr:aldo/keto reductase [Gammaproteobacteria bacterium]
MKYARLGNSGLIISRFSFGVMTFGEGEFVPGVINHIDHSKADKMVGRCIDAGINLFDTADVYSKGQSETMLGKILGSKRKDVIIATKVGFRTGENLMDSGLSRWHIMNAVEASLRRLNTDYIDIYMIHIHDPFTPIEETAAALEYLIKQGMVRYLGFSNLPAWVATRYVDLQQHLGYDKFIAGQMYYSLLGRDLEHELVPCFDMLGIGIMGWSPLAGGFLTGKYTRENPAPKGSRRERFSLPPVDLDKGYDIIETLQKIGIYHGATPAEIALAWTLTKPFMSTILIGANRIEQLESNLRAIELHLAEDEVNELDKLTAPQPIYPGWMMPLGKDPVLSNALKHNEQTLLKPARENSELRGVIF